MLLGEAVEMLSDRTGNAAGNAPSVMALGTQESSC